MLLWLSLLLLLVKSVVVVVEELLLLLLLLLRAVLVVVVVVGQEESDDALGREWVDPESVIGLAVKAIVIFNTKKRNNRARQRWGIKILFRFMDERLVFMTFRYRTLDRRLCVIPQQKFLCCRSSSEMTLGLLF